jgi:aminopeptidase
MYAELLIRRGVNLQPGQSLRIGAELEHADLVRRVTSAAYRAGARYGHVDWADTPTTKQRLLHSQAEYLEFIPGYEITRHQEMVNDTWARLALTGDAYPDLYDDVDPSRLRKIGQVRAQKLRFYSQAQMANQLPWCVAGVPTKSFLILTRRQRTHSSGRPCYAPVVWISPTRWRPGDGKSNC